MGSSSETAGEESERISWPTQKPTLLMTLSAVISGCYLSWLPGAHLLRITNLHTLLPPRLSLFLASLLSPPPLLSACPYAIRITESGDLFRRAAFFRPNAILCISLKYIWINKKSLNVYSDLQIDSSWF